MSPLPLPAPPLYSHIHTPPCLALNAFTCTLTCLLSLCCPHLPLLSAHSNLFPTSGTVPAGHCHAQPHCSQSSQQPVWLKASKQMGTSMMSCSQTRPSPGGTGTSCVSDGAANTPRRSPRPGWCGWHLKGCLHPALSEGGCPFPGCSEANGICSLNGTARPGVIPHLSLTQAPLFGNLPTVSPSLESLLHRRGYERN